MVTPAYPWDANRNLKVLHKPCKYHVSSLLAAITYHPNPIRCIADFHELTDKEQAVFIEWVVSQELQRLNAISGASILEPQMFWQTKTHEIDFVNSENDYIEVKRGQACALEFSWFAHTFPNKKLTIINKQFLTQKITGISLEEFLLSDNN